MPLLLLWLPLLWLPLLLLLLIAGAAVLVEGTEVVLMVVEKSVAVLVPEAEWRFSWKVSTNCETVFEGLRSLFEETRLGVREEGEETGVDEIGEVTLLSPAGGEGPGSGIDLTFVSRAFRAFSRRASSSLSITLKVTSWELEWSFRRPMRCWIASDMATDPYAELCLLKSMTTGDVIPPPSGVVARCPLVGDIIPPYTAEERGVGVLCEFCGLWVPWGEEEASALLCGETAR